MTAVITGHCRQCSGPVVSDPDAELCRACWAANVAPVEDGAFVEAVNAHESAIRTCHDLTVESPTAVAVAASKSRVAARARVLALHAAAVNAAEARGRAAGLAAVDAACEVLWNDSPDGVVELSRSHSGWYVQAATLWTPTPEDDAATPTAAILAAAAALAPDAPEVAP